MGTIAFLNRIPSPQWIKTTKSYTDFAAASLTNDIEIYSLPAGGIVQGVVIKTSTAFTGGLITAYTISVGITGNLVKYAAAFNTLQPVSDTTFQTTSNFSVENWGDVTSIRAAATSVTGLLNTATAGSVDIYLLIAIVKS